ncbi:MAG: VOC family protein [Bauldia sp.]|nr:VOC family protein [Bauldia sp.]
MDAAISVRIIVDDIPAAVAFYTGPLGFALEAQTPAFAAVVKHGLKLLLSGPKSAGGKPLPDGTAQAPGGWNRVMLTVTDIASEIVRLKAAGVPFRGEPVTGPAGTLAILDDPSGNPIELWQPAAH